MNTNPVKQAYSSASTSFSEQAIFYYIKKYSLMRSIVELSASQSMTP